MSEFYLVDGIGGGFDGLVVEGVVYDDLPFYVHASRIFDPNKNVGDRVVSIPIPPHGLLISKMFLKKTDDPSQRQFASDNPFGRPIVQGLMTLGNIEVAYTQFTSVLSVNVFNSTDRKTLFSQYFSKDLDKVMDAIESILKENGGTDPDDLVFKLRELKEKESNGQG